MGAQLSSTSTSAPDSVYHPDPPRKPSSISEPSASEECHACASTPDSAAAVTPAPVPNLSPAPNSSPSDATPCYAYSHSACPLNRAELGRTSWAYLHTLAAYYPASPTASQQSLMSTFLTSYMQLYPCGYCADRSMEELQRNPPRTSSQAQLAVWMCEVHNEVNERLNKPIFDCSLTRERWKTGPDDGACQPPRT